MTNEHFILYGSTLLPPVAAGAYFWLTERRARRAYRKAAVPQEVEIHVEDGLHPVRVALEARRPIRLRFTRPEDGASWWDDVEFPYAFLRRELPQGETITIDVRPLEPGDYTYFVALGTLRGTLVVEDAERSAGLPRCTQPGGLDRAEVGEGSGRRATAMAVSA